MRSYLRRPRRGQGAAGGNKSSFSPFHLSHITLRRLPFSRQPMNREPREGGNPKHGQRFFLWRRPDPRLHQSTGNSRRHLVDVSATAHEAGFMIPVALTAALHADVNDLSGKYVTAGQDARQAVESAHDRPPEPRQARERRQLRVRFRLAHACRRETEAQREGDDRTRRRRAARPDPAAADRRLADQQAIHR